MVIELRRFFEGDDTSLNIDYAFDGGDSRFAAPVGVSGSLTSRSGIVRLSAKAYVTVNEQCAKCAEQIQRSMSVPLEHIIVDSLNDEDNDEYDEYIVCEDMTLDLDRLACEDIYLAMPIRFLCKNDCKGLCPYCGANLNLGPCGCKAPVDARLSALSKLLTNEE